MKPTKADLQVLYKKLHLRTETLKNLTAKKLELARGGDGPGSFVINCDPDPPPTEG